jgi:AraC family transcriptional regulator
MLANLGRPVPVTELAQVCGMGVTSFSSSFRRATGMTPHRYLRRARIERASELLRTTGLSVGEISAAVGFRGQGHFCTAFAAERGITPSRYRRESRTTRSR